jgi:hypothetical protein
MQKVGIGENASETEHAKDSVTTTGRNNHHSEDNTIIVINVMLGREVLIIAMHLCSEVREGAFYLLSDNRRRAVKRQKKSNQ